MQENIKRIIAVRHGQSVGNIARHEAFLRDNNSFYEDLNFLNINQPLLRERNYASFDKLTKEDWQRRLKEANISDFEYSYDWKVPGGESAKDIEKRLDNFLSKLSEIKTDSDDTFIFTHGDLLQVL